MSVYFDMSHTICSNSRVIKNKVEYCLVMAYVPMVSFLE